MVIRSLFYINVKCVFNSDLELKPVGTLDVKLVQAKDLANKDMIGKSDPYAVLFIRPLPDKTKKTKTIVRDISFFTLTKTIGLCPILFLINVI